MLGGGPVTPLWLQSRLVLYTSAWSSNANLKSEGGGGQECVFSKNNESPSAPLTDDRHLVQSIVCYIVGYSFT